MKLSSTEFAERVVKVKRRFRVCVCLQSCKHKCSRVHAEVRSCWMTKPSLIIMISLICIYHYVPCFSRYTPGIRSIRMPKG